MRRNGPLRRKALTPGVLYRILSAELQARRKRPCQCRMPFPFVVEAGSGESANWRIPRPRRCAQGCDVLIADIVKSALVAFDVRDPTVTPRKAHLDE